MLQVLIFEFLKFRIFEVLTFHPCFTVYTHLGKGKLVHCPVEHLTLCILMEFSIKYFKVKSGCFVVYIEGAQDINSK